MSSDPVSVEALRAGDERAFERLVDELSPRMLRTARVYVSATATAEEVVQEAWIAVIRGLDGFEGRSALSTWVLGIVINLARARYRRDARTVPFATLGDGLGDGGPSLGPDRFLPADHQYAGHWSIAPAPWPDQALETAEATRVIREAIAALPDLQRAVITLRDMVGATAEETCNALDITDTNHRVLLHRARTKVRAALETAFGATVRLV